MPQPHRAAGERMDRRAVGRAVIRHHALDRDAVAVVERDRAAQEADGCGGFLVGQDLDVGQAGGVIDADVDELPAGGAAAAALADDLAALLSGGAALIAALDAVACSPPAGIEPVFAAARDEVRSGIGWDAALASAEHPGLAAIGEVIGRTRRCGIAPAAALRELARRLDEEARTEFDRALQRAPVLMVVPLTVCVLPAFAILAFGPFLLGAVSS